MYLELDDVGVAQGAVVEHLVLHVLVDVVPSHQKLDCDVLSRLLDAVQVDEAKRPRVQGLYQLVLVMVGQRVLLRHCAEAALRRF
jgi:hypothetical protein